MSFKKQMLRFLKDERGQSTTEYILILAVVVMIAMKFKGEITKRLVGLVDKVGADMGKVTEQDF